MKKIMIVAGGDWQVPITKKAKEMGLYVISSNLYQNSPAFAFADVGEVADVLDVEGNLAFARSYKPDAVITDQSDIAVPTVAAVCEKMGLRGIGTEKASLFTNKYRMREFCKANGFNSPDFRLCYQVEDALEFLEEYGRIIIKPIDSQSSRGVFIIESRTQLLALFQVSMEYSHAQKAVLAEEYVDGTEFTVDGIKTPEQHFVLAISKKRHYPENPNVASELFFSNTDDRYDYQILREENSRLVMAMGLPFGLTHAEYKYQDGKFYLIEIAARGGGTKISSDIVSIMSEVDSNEALIKMALGDKVEIQPRLHMGRCAVLKFLSFKPGKVKQICGLQEIRKMEGVDDIALNFKVGDSIQPMHDDRSRQGYYIAYAESKSALLTLEEKLEKQLVIIYEDKGDSVQ